MTSMVALTGLPTCAVCGETAEIVVSAEDFALITAWKAKRGLIQNYLPHWSPSQREVLLSGTCPECSDALFGPE